MDTKRLGGIIHARRDELGWSLERLGVEASRTGQTFRDIESGDANPTIETIVLAAEALGLDPAELLAAAAPHAPGRRRVGA